MKNTINQIHTHGTAGKTHTHPPGEICTKSNLTSTIQAARETEIHPQIPATCSMRNEKSTTRYKFTHRLKRNVVCNILHQIGKFTPLARPNAHRNDCCANEKTLGNIYGIVFA